MATWWVLLTLVFLSFLPFQLKNARPRLNLRRKLEWTCCGLSNRLFLSQDRRFERPCLPAGQCHQRRCAEAFWKNRPFPNFRFVLSDVNGGGQLGRLDRDAGRHRLA